MSFDVTYPKRRYDEVSGIAPVRSQLVYPGHAIQTEPGFLQGRNTIIRNGQLVATVCGVVERVNKLVLVNPLKSRYLGDIGDVVVGRVEEIGNQRWFVDIGAGLRGQLSLNAINLPDSVQRRRTDEDMMEMRKYFVEGDVVSTEIQKWSSDTVQLHTRSAKYGKLQNGCLVKVTPQLVRRQQLHFIKLACGVSIVLGCNGQIWVGLPNRDSHLDTLNYAMSSAEYENVPIEKRKEIARVGWSSLSHFSCLPTCSPLSSLCLCLSCLFLV